MPALRAAIWLTLLAAAPLARAAPTPGLKLRQVKVDGKAYYATYRVCSASRAQCLMNTGDKLRWRPSDNVWQYGSGFYLFGTVKDARKFIECSRNGAAHLLVKDPRTPVKARETILEVLIPKERMDHAAKARVPRGLDWADERTHPRHTERESLRGQNDVLYGGWQEDPRFPFAAYKPMVGTPQLAVINTGAGSLLNDALIRIVGHNMGQPGAVRATPRRPRSSFRVDPALPRTQRIQAVIDHNRREHAELHRVLDGPISRHQARAAIDYLSSKFATAKVTFPRESGTWEGFTIRGHTMRAYNVLSSQLRHVDLQGIARAYPEINVKRTLQLALLLHDVGKPVAIDKARGLVDSTLAAGKSLESLDRAKLRHHSVYSRSMMSRIMWQLGANVKEIRLARSLVACDALGQLEQGKTNMTGARDQLKRFAERSGLRAADYFKLQSLFYTADAGSYRSLRRSVFERGKDGRLVPGSMGYQMLQMQLGD